MERGDGVEDRAERVMACVRVGVEARDVICKSADRVERHLTQRSVRLSSSRSRNSLQVLINPFPPPGISPPHALLARDRLAAP